MTPFTAVQWRYGIGSYKSPENVPGLAARNNSKEVG
jgi:hypothetical protein